MFETVKAHQNRIFIKKNYAKVPIKTTALDHCCSTQQNKSMASLR